MGLQSMSSYRIMKLHTQSSSIWIPGVLFWCRLIWQADTDMNNQGGQARVGAHRSASVLLHNGA